MTCVNCRGTGKITIVSTKVECPACGNTSKSETGWLIERTDNILLGAPYYFGFLQHRYDYKWITDSQNAVRFARKQDADEIIQYLHITGAEAQEHIWLGKNQ